MNESYSIHFNTVILFRLLEYSPPYESLYRTLLSRPDPVSFGKMKQSRHRSPTPPGPAFITKCIFSSGRNSFFGSLLFFWWRETDPFILMQRIFDTGIILCQHAAGTGDTHCFGGYCQCQQKCMIHDPRSTFHHSWSCVSATATKTWKTREGCGPRKREEVFWWADSSSSFPLSLSLSSISKICFIYETAMKPS